MNTNIENIRLVVCDIDNTLLPAGASALSRHTAEALRKVISSGRRLLICTGRHYTLLPESFFDDLPMDLIGTINGACLNRRDGSVIEKHPMSEKNMNDITQFCMRLGIGLGFKFEDAIVTYANYDRFVHGYVRDDPKEKAKIVNNDAMRDHHLQYGYPLGTFLIGDEKDIEPLKDSVKELVFAWSYRNGYDVFLRNINKTTAVERVLRDAGLGWQNVIAFGDAGNDTPMIEKAAIGVAMGNARDDVREHADLVAEPCSEDGVARTLEKLHMI